MRKFFHIAVTFIKTLSFELLLSIIGLVVGAVVLFAPYFALRYLFCDEVLGPDLLKDTVLYLCVVISGLHGRELIEAARGGSDDD